MNNITHSDLISTDLGSAHAGAAVTMSSREIAELTGKRHDHILRDIEKMIQDIDAPNFGAVDFEAKYQDGKGEWRKEYLLPKDLTVTLVTGYRADLRYKVVKKLEELEGRQDPAIILSDPNQLRSLLLVNVEKVIELESRVSAMLPAVEALEQIAEAHGSMNRTETAKHLGVAPHVLCKWMRTNAWTYRRAGTKDDIAYQSKINAGYTLDYVAEMLEEDEELLQAIISNDDNLTYGNIITVVTGDDQTTSALTDDGIDELRQMLADARRSAVKWQEFLECFVDDEEIIARVKTYSQR